MVLRLFSMTERCGGLTLMSVPLGSQRRSSPLVCSLVGVATVSAGRRSRPCTGGVRHLQDQARRRTDGQRRSRRCAHQKGLVTFGPLVADGVRAKTCDPAELPPSIVTSKSVTASKSVDSSAESPSTETVSTTSFESGAPFSVAVTVTSREPPSSSTADVSTPMRTAVNAASLSNQLGGGLCHTACGAYRVERWRS